MNHLLDTQTFLWLVTGAPELPDMIRSRLESDPALLGVSAAVTMELAIKARLGRLQPDRKGALRFDRPFRDWITEAIPTDKFQLVPLTPEIVADAFDLPDDFHSDPFDCLMVATARVLAVPLVTSDGLIGAYPHVRKVIYTPVRKATPSETA